MGINIKQIKAAPYNPRKIKESQYNGLKTSMDEFGDISGITWNKLTGNLVTGHQRWTKLNNEYNDLTLIHEVADRFRIVSQSKSDTGFFLRMVEWDEAKEKLANLSANNHAIEGEWEKDLLHSLINDSKDHELFENLNLDILEFDIKPDQGDEWDSDIDSMGKIKENLDGIKARIIIECEQDLKDEVLIYIKAKLMETSFEGVHVK